MVYWSPVKIANVILSVLSRRGQLAAIFDTTYVLYFNLRCLNVMCLCLLTSNSRSRVQPVAGKEKLVFFLGCSPVCAFQRCRLMPDRGGVLVPSVMRGCFPGWEACETADQLSRVWM
jgi:hypothetical protein